MAIFRIGQISKHFCDYACSELFWYCSSKFKVHINKLTFMVPLISLDSVLRSKFQLRGKVHPVFPCISLSYLSSRGSIHGIHRGCPFSFKFQLSYLLLVKRYLNFLLHKWMSLSGQPLDAHTTLLLAVSRILSSFRYSLL